MDEVICIGCRLPRRVVRTDNNDLHYCAKCAAVLPEPSETRALKFLLATLPFTPGERVECRTGGQIYDGVGTVDDVSFDFEKTGGTIIYPAFHVVIDQPAYPDAPEEGWYNEATLQRVMAK